MEHYEFSSYVGPYEIMAVTGKGALRKIRCPFRVVCTSMVEGLRYNSTYYVDKVEEGGYNSICYIVGHRMYPHHLFRIYLAF